MRRRRRTRRRKAAEGEAGGARRGVPVASPRLVLLLARLGSCSAARLVAAARIGMARLCSIGRAWLVGLSAAGYLFCFLLEVTILRLVVVLTELPKRCAASRFVLAFPCPFGPSAGLPPGPACAQCGIWRRLALPD